MTKRNKILSAVGAMFILALVLTAGYQDRQVFVIDERDLADLVNNDSMYAAVDIGSAENVAVQFMLSDSLNATVQMFYGFGNQQRVALADADSMNLVNVASPVSIGKTLRGYGLATDKLPGANKLYIRATVRDSGQIKVTPYLKVGIITSD